MNNLFIMHTQYNLILSIGIVSRLDMSAQNNLIVYAEFDVSQELERKLSEIFSSVLYIRKKFEKLKHGINKEKQLHQQVKISKQFLSYEYDNVYISQDRQLELVLLKQIKRKNADCRFFSVEEDVYFSLKKPFFRQRVKSLVKRPFENILHLALYHETTNNGYYSCYGMNPVTSYLYVLFPDAVRGELRYKTIEECTSEMLVAGIKKLYGESLKNKKTGLIIVSDLIERYKNREAVVSLFNEITMFCERSGVKLYIKYHPRETNKIQTECQIQELPTNVAVEKLYLDFDESKTVVLGNMSTSILTAKKLGFKTISVMKMNDPQQNAITAYEKIGIEMPVSNNEMLSFIDDGLNQ